MFGKRLYQRRRPFGQLTESEKAELRKRISGPSYLVKSIDSLASALADALYRDILSIRDKRQCLVRRFEE